MNLAETSQLLTVVNRLDNRKVDDATVFAWQSVIGDLSYDDALAAVRLHFATEESYLMPATVRRLVLQLHNDRAREKPHEIRALPSRFEDDDDRELRLARGVAACRQAIEEMARMVTIPEDEPLKPSSVASIHERAAIRARRERGRVEKPKPTKAKKGPPKDWPAPQSDDVAATATRYLIDGYEPNAVAERLAVSRRWCRNAAAKFNRAKPA